MKLLVDAQPLLWRRAGDPRLPEKAREALSSARNELFVSEATFWEIALKVSWGKLELRGGADSLRDEWILRGAARALPIEWRHTRRVIDLPFVHRDPFDRMLVAQALEERFAIVTGDPFIGRYAGVKTLW